MRGARERDGNAVAQIFVLTSFFFLLLLFFFLAFWPFEPFACVRVNFGRVSPLGIGVFDRYRILEGIWTRLIRLMDIATHIKVFECSSHVEMLDSCSLLVSSSVLLFLFLFFFISG